MMVYTPLDDETRRHIEALRTTPPDQSWCPDHAAGLSARPSDLQNR